MPDAATNPAGLPAALERLRVGALTRVQLLVSKYRRGLAEAAAGVTGPESAVLQDLQDRGLDASGLRVMLHGGHIVIDDPDLYDRWVFAGSVQRLSSHHRDVDKKKYPDYGMTGPFVRQSLHGRTRQGTWIQWERTPADYKFGQRITWTDVVHIKDFVVYRITRKNVGPWGLSDATEKRPLYLSPRVGVSRALPAEVVAGFLVALDAARRPERTPSDPVRGLFAPPPLERFSEAVAEGGARRRGVLGGVPIARRRVPVPGLKAALTPPAREGREAVPAGGGGR
jgi:hypothetical protein